MIIYFPVCHLLMHKKIVSLQSLYLYPVSVKKPTSSLIFFRLSKCTIHFFLLRSIERRFLSLEVKTSGLTFKRHAYLHCWIWPIVSNPWKYFTCYPFKMRNNYITMLHLTMLIVSFVALHGWNIADTA
mgnify:CR=1 FL=1